MSALGRALLDELGPEDLAELARRLAPHLPAAPAPDGWLTTRQAAAYAGCSVNALHKAMAAREIEFEQSTPGGKAWFRRSAIDAWRRGH
jgi:excisionase family DNA binding protein